MTKYISSRQAIRDLSESYVELYVADELGIYKSTNLIGKNPARRTYFWRINFFLANALGKMIWELFVMQRFVNCFS